MLRRSLLVSSRTLSRISHLRAFSSSFAEPNPTLFVPLPNNLKDDENAQLRADIKVMGSVLGQVLRDNDDQVFDRVESMRAAAKNWRQGNGDLKALADQASNLTDSQLRSVSRAFTHFLALANAAEAHHRIRRLSKYKDAPLFPKADSCGGVIPQLLKEGKSAEEIFEALTTQTTELVLTAHPTEVNRRTVLNKNRTIQKILTAADVETNAYERQQLDDALLQQIRSLWLTDEVSRVKPSPEMEAAKGTLVIETVLWRAVPSYLRKLSSTLTQNIGKPLPLTAAPIKFASWMGGDRKYASKVTVCVFSFDHVSQETETPTLNLTQQTPFA